MRSAPADAGQLARTTWDPSWTRVCDANIISGDGCDILIGPHRRGARSMKVRLVVRSDRLEWSCDSQEAADVVQVHEIIRIVTDHGTNRPMHKTAIVAATALRARGVEVEIDDHSFDAA